MGYHLCCAVVLLAVAIQVTISAPVIPLLYPQYTQCDATWKDHIMGMPTRPTSTICADGCQLSALASMVAGKGYKIGNNAITPNVLADYLRDNNGYWCYDVTPSRTDCWYIQFHVLNYISNTTIKFVDINLEPTPAEIRTFIDGGIVNLVAYVRGQGIWVLLVGYDDVDRFAFYSADPSGKGNRRFQSSELSNYIKFEIQATNDTYVTASPRAQQISWPPAWLDYFNGLSGDPLPDPQPDPPVSSPEELATAAAAAAFGGLGIVGFGILIAAIFVVMVVAVFILVLLLRNKVRQENARLEQAARKHRKRRKRAPTHHVEVKEKTSSSGKRRVVTETLSVGELDGAELVAPVGHDLEEPQ